MVQKKSRVFSIYLNMRNFIVSLIIASSFGFLANSQTIVEGDYYFDNYEFDSAAKVYASLYTKNKLNKERTEKLAYCYLRTGANERGLTLIDSIISTHSDEYEFWLWKSGFERELEQYNQAISSIKQYESLGGKEDINLFVKSCELLRDNKIVVEGELTNFLLNDHKANFTQRMVNRELYLMESGLDSAGNYLEFAENDQYFAEIVLMRPFFMEENQLKPWKLLTEEFWDLSINSIHLDQSSNTVYFAASKPLEKDLMNKASRIYTASFSGFDSQVSEIKLWDKAMEDSASYAQISFSNDGNTMLFTKVSRLTEMADLYVTQKEKGVWGEPTALSEINSGGDDLFPTLIGDSLFTFSSDGRVGYGGLDIYGGKVLSLNPFKVEGIDHLPAPINSTKDDFLLNYYSPDSMSFVSNRLTGKGDDDIWFFVLPPKPEDPKPNIDEFISNWHLKRIYFDFDLSVSADDIGFVKPLVELLNQGVDIKIKLVGHTDSRGTKKYNYDLGLTRANWVKEQLEAKGIATDRITIVSVGDTELVNMCTSEIFWCNEVQHQENRFVQIFLEK